MTGGGEGEGHRARSGSDGDRMDNRPVGKVAVVGCSAGVAVCVLSASVCPLQKVFLCGWEKLCIFAALFIV